MAVYAGNKLAYFPGFQALEFPSKYQLREYIEELTKPIRTHRLRGKTISNC